MLWWHLTCLVTFLRMHLGDVEITQILCMPSKHIVVCRKIRQMLGCLYWCGASAERERDFNILHNLLFLIFHGDEASYMGKELGLTLLDLYVILKRHAKRPSTLFHEKNSILLINKSKSPLKPKILLIPTWHVYLYADVLLMCYLNNFLIQKKLLEQKKIKKGSQIPKVQE